MRRSARIRISAARYSKQSTVRYYVFQLDRFVLAALGSTHLWDLNRVRIEAFLSDLRRKGQASATIRGVRTTLTVSETLME